METITFYSYKGGVGRTLAMANVAKWLSEFNKTVCLLDFDLEAPGLHFKFRDQLKSFEFKRGVVDYIHDFVVTGEVPKTVTDCIETFKTSSKNPPIHFFPAGNSSSPEYWKKLAAISWNDLFYKQNSEGVPFFLDLKEKIRTELKPDFLLVDSRTGISEISGITMSLYADKIVIVAANNDENLIGARDVIKSITNPENNFFNKTPEIIFVLSRIPFPEKGVERALESVIIRSAAKKVNLKSEDEILVIHSDRELELEESLKIGYNRENKVPIVEDYLNLFDRITLNSLTEDDRVKFNNIKEAEAFAEEAKKAKSPNDKIELLSKAILLNSENEEFYLRRGQAFFDKQEFNDALGDFNLGLNLNQFSLRLYYERSRTYYRLKEYLSAIRDLELIISIDNKDIYALTSLGIAYEAIKKYDIAIQKYQLAIDIAPAFYDAYNGISNSYRKIKNYELALAFIYKAIELNPKAGIFYGTLAEINAELGNENEFFRNIELALIFDAPVEEFLSDEVYKPYLGNQKFKALLKKYKKKIPQ